VSSAFAFPYKTVPEELVELGPWERFDQHGDAETVGEDIAGWDYDSHMEFGRSIKFHPKTIIKSLGLKSTDSGLSVIVTAETGPTSYRWLVSRADVPDAATWKHDIRFEVSSANLAQRLSLTTEIILAGEVGKPATFAPSESGSRLFRDVQVLQLEGSLGRFPMEMIDFQKGLPFLQAPHALWYLDWDPSRPESQFLGTVLLYINSAHPEVSNLVQAAEPTIISVLSCDVIRAMCESMLQNEDFVANYADFETDMVGGQVREWLQLAYGGERPELIKSKLDSSPGRFEARIQSTFS
jgi:hypothetical protein